MRILLFRGLIGAVFSTGMDRLAAKLKAQGHDTSVHSWVERAGLQNRLSQQIANREFPDGVAAIGHSLGGNSANYLARNMHKKGTPLSYLATIDPTEPRANPEGLIADNFRSDDFRAEKVEGAVDHHRPDLNHIQIDKDDAVHNIIMDRLDEASVSSNIASPVVAASSVNDELRDIIAKLDNNNLDLSEIDIQGLFKGVAEQINTSEDRPIRNALGVNIGNLLDGRKTGYGILGLVATTVLPIAFPQLAPVKAVLESVDLVQAAAAAEPGQSILLPIFSALTGWGLLDKADKWVRGIKQISRA